MTRVSQLNEETLVSISNTGALYSLFPRSKTSVSPEDTIELRNTITRHSFYIKLYASLMFWWISEHALRLGSALFQLNYIILWSNHILITK